VGTAAKFDLKSLGPANFSSGSQLRLPRPTYTLGRVSAINGFSKRSDV
jgi:hypothetical protein